MKNSALYHDFSGIMSNLSSTIENFFGNLSKTLVNVSIFQMTSSKEHFKDKKFYFIYMKK